jgi:hypothetical protein
MRSRVATPNADSGHDNGLFCVTDKCLRDITVVSVFFTLVGLSAACTIPAHTFSYTLLGKKI